MCTIYRRHISITTPLTEIKINEYKRGRNLRGGCRLRAWSALASREYNSVVRFKRMQFFLSLTVMSNSFNRFYFLPSPFLMHILLLLLLLVSSRAIVLVNPSTSSTPHHTPTHHERVQRHSNNIYRYYGGVVILFANRGRAISSPSAMTQNEQFSGRTPSASAAVPSRRKHFIMHNIEKKKPMPWYDRFYIFCFNFDSSQFEQLYFILRRYIEYIYYA